MKLIFPCFSRGNFLLLVLLWSLRRFCIATTTTSAAADGGECLYAVLGVSKRASTAEIKRAYRRKALDTHPDKNPNQEEAAVKFRQVVDAFEVLSDPIARRRYDATGRTTTTNTHHQHQHQQHQFYQWNFHYRRRRPQLKDHPKVKEAKLRVMHIVSLAQLETVMLNTSDETLERHLLLCFVTPQTEQIMEDAVLYPYPFAGMSKQGIWWEDILQTAIVRHHTMKHELVKYFDIPNSNDANAPVFVFVKKNKKLSEDRAVYTTNNRIDFEHWVWDQLQVDVTFVNNHSHDVELYWIDGSRANFRTRIPPGERHGERTMLSHAYVVRDARVDAFDGSPGRHKLMPNALLASWTVTSTTPSELLIETKRCMDMSGHCGYWSDHPRPGECHRNRGFMHEMCPLTCGVCDNDGNNSTTGADRDTTDSNDEL